MNTITFTEFRDHAAHFFDLVQGGECIVVTRHGKPVVRMEAIFEGERILSWQRPARPLEIKGVSLGKEIILERGQHRS